MEAFSLKSREQCGGEICIAARKSNKPRKRLSKGKQMFVNKVIEEEVFAAGKGERGRFFGIDFMVSKRAVGAVEKDKKFILSMIRRLFC